MWWVRRLVQPQTEVLALKVLALENNAARAGVALACSYANSHEYEAELIAERRAAGAYGPKRGKRRTLVAAIAAGAAVVVLFLLLII